MDNLTFQRIKDLVMQHQNLGVVIAPNPSLDIMAAGLGMYLALSQMGKQAIVACPTDTTVALSSLVGIDKVQKSLGGVGGDLTVAFPYNEGEIDKVSYTLENGLLNIVVKAGSKGISFGEKDIQFKRSGSIPKLLFFIGIARPEDVAQVVSTEDIKNTTIVNIDNNAANQGYGDVAVVSSKFSSRSEQVADFLTLLEPQIELDVDTSQDLLSGILFATNDFKMPQTSYLAFEMAGILMKKGAVRKDLVGGGQSLPNNMPAQSFFPPTQPMQPQASTPIQQPVQSEPMEFVPTPQPSQPVQQQPTQQQPANQNEQAPSDWLTPKVYKGSTIL